MSSVAYVAEVMIEGQRGLNVIVNNAGSGSAMPTLDIDIEKGKGGLRGQCLAPYTDRPSLYRPPGQEPQPRRQHQHHRFRTPTALDLASKAVMTLQAEALRFELEPFGVSVVAIMTGIICSNFHANHSGAEIKLPAKSRYSSIADVIAGWATGKPKLPGVTAEAFSEQILDDVVGQGKGGVVWRSPNAGSVKIAKWLMPATMLDNAMWKGQRLEELERNFPEEG
ncbi:hypothetical protein F5Y19DRAFT_474192 [Xylariaceae sp. FL1651]|nr:hypothetical protein F5Y19DRAFT_474192 [Xylariaceae sp. FL1651]